MTIYIYTKNVNALGIVEESTFKTFQQLYPAQKIMFTQTLNFDDKQSDDGFTIVVPGGNLISLAEEMKDSGNNTKCREAVDNGASYIGLCAGAYLGAERYIGVKDHHHPYYVFDIDRQS